MGETAGMIRPLILGALLMGSAQAAGIIGTKADPLTSALCRTYGCVFNRTDRAQPIGAPRGYVAETSSYSLTGGTLWFGLEVFTENGKKENAELTVMGTPKVSLKQASKTDIALISELMRSFGPLQVSSALITRCLRHQFGERGSLVLAQTSRLFAACDSSDSASRPGPASVNFRIFRLQGPPPPGTN